MMMLDYKLILSLPARSAPLYEAVASSPRKHWPKAETRSQS
jgi:hypothetical protein